MSTFQIGDRVVHNWGAYRLTYGTIMGKLSTRNSYYILPENTNIFGNPIHRCNNLRCYLLSGEYLTLLKEGEKFDSVLYKIKSLDNRFKNKTLPKTTMKPLALPR